MYVMYWMLKSEVIFKGRSVLKQGCKEKSGKFQCRGEYSFNTLVRSCRTGNISAAWIGQRCYCSALRDVSREVSQVWASANCDCHVCGVGTDQRSRGFLCAGWLEKVQPQIMRKTGISDLFVNYENIAWSAWKCLIVQVMMLYLTINCVVEYWKIAVICKGISVKRWSWCWGSQRWIFVQNFGKIGKNWLKNCQMWGKGREASGQGWIFLQHLWRTGWYMLCDESFSASISAPKKAEWWQVRFCRENNCSSGMSGSVCHSEQAFCRIFSQQGFTRRGQVKMGSRG